MRRVAVAFVLAAGVLVAAVPVPTAAVHETGQSFVVRLEADGDATVSVQTRYDLTNATERERFERFVNDSTAREERARRFHDRMTRAIARAQGNTERVMSIEPEGRTRLNATRLGNETGLVRVSVNWTNLARVDAANSQVVLSEPFASGFGVNRSLVVHGPEGFTRAGTTPAPERARRNSATWAADTDLAGFRAAFSGDVVTPTATATQADDAGGDGGDGDDGSDGGDGSEPSRPSGAGALLVAAAVALVPAVLAAVGIRAAG